MPSSRQPYQALEQQEVEQQPRCLDKTCVGHSFPQPGEAIWTRKQAQLTLAASLLLALTSICVPLWSLFGPGWSSTMTTLECAKKVSPYSPIWEAVEFWEGDFANYFNHTSIYRGPPTLEREQAWDALWYYHLIGVDSAGVAALNKTHEGQKIEVIGSDPAHPTYGATIEVFHQLHCLNVIRQYTWPLDMYDKSWGRLYPAELVEDLVGARMHVDHCLEAIRLSLMCYADITPLFLYYDEHSHPHRKADFNVHHKCRRFESIVDYFEKNVVEIPPLNTSITTP